MRTLIVAQGLERNRILAAVSVHAPNKVVFLRNTNEVSKALGRQVQTHVDAVRNTLLPLGKKKKAYPFVFRVDEERCDFFDLVEAYTTVKSLVRREREGGNEVFMDISSGNKTAAMAMFLAAQTERVPATYCKAAQYFTSKKRRSEHDEIAISAKEPVMLPYLPLEVKPLALGLLKELSNGSAESVSELVTRMGGKTTKSELLSTSRKLEALAEHGYVTLKREGKRKRVSLTENGKRIASMGE